MAAFKIYGLKEGDSVRYIGQTKFSLDKRYKEHLKENKPCYKNSWIKSLLINGSIPEIELIDECETREEANEKEIHYIKLFKSLGARLVNMTIGGVAPMKDKRHSDEHKNRLRESMIGNGNPFYGKKHSQETREKMSKHKQGKSSWAKGRVFTNEHRKKLSDVRVEKIKLGLIKIHNKQVSSIDKYMVFKLRKDGLKQKEIAYALNCDASNISRILNNKYEFKKRKSVSKVSASLKP
jgi:group I intron endonuclease